MKRFGAATFITAERQLDGHLQAPECVVNTLHVDVNSCGPAPDGAELSRPVYDH